MRARARRTSGFVKRDHNHCLHGDHHNALFLTAADQLGEEYADFDGFAETDRIGEQDAMPGLTESPEGRIELIRHHVKGGA